MDLESLSTFEAIKISFPWIIDLTTRIRIPGLSGAVEVVKRVEDYAHQSIQRYEKIFNDPEKANTIKPTLLTKLFDFEKSGLSRDQIQKEAQIYIVAGSDTTANTLTYLVHALSSEAHSDVRDKLLSELSNLSEDVSDRDLRELPYLNHVINETLRLFGPIPSGLPRAVPAEGATLSGNFIPGGTAVSSQSYSLQRNPNVFPDPDA